MLNLDLLVARENVIVAIVKIEEKIVFIANTIIVFHRCGSLISQRTE